MTAATDRDAKQDIAEVLVRYTAAIDRRDWDLLRTCFTEDCRADYGGIGSWRGVDGITDYMVTAHAGMGHTLHRLSNIVVSLDGDAADARSYVDAVVMAADGRSGINAMGFYDDRLERTGAGWRIAERRFTRVHVGALAAGT
ncbi:MAG TPA: nuclear transport factor 2 family protein [Acidimicrobiales bacterium]|nr:nuclear transport factor 2 family protein [Acidimicrobiales bacterium]